LEELKQKITYKPNPKEYVKMAMNFKKKGVFFDENGKPKEVQIDEKHYEDLKEYQSDEEGLRDKGKRYLEIGGRVNKKHKPSKHPKPDGNTSLPEDHEGKDNRDKSITGIRETKRVDYLK
jgi:hypothetical protein